MSPRRPRRRMGAPAGERFQTRSRLEKPRSRNRGRERHSPRRDATQGAPHVPWVTDEAPATGRGVGRQTWPPGGRTPKAGHTTRVPCPAQSRRSWGRCSPREEGSWTRCPRTMNDPMPGRAGGVARGASRPRPPRPPNPGADSRPVHGARALAPKRGGLRASATCGLACSRTPDPREAGPLGSRVL